MPHDTLAHLAALTRRLRDVLLAEMAAHQRSTGTDATWRAHQERFSRQTGISGNRPFADSVAQAVTCGCFGLQNSRAEGLPAQATDWLIDQADPLVQDILRLCSARADSRHHSPAVVGASNEITRFLGPEQVEAIRGTVPDTTRTLDAPVYFYEPFLQAYDRQTRRRKGVFYTPHALVSFVVRSVDDLLHDEFSLSDGIADDATWHDLHAPACCSDGSEPPRSGPPFVRILDPAMGTGAFLLEVVATARRRFDQRMTRDSIAAHIASELWDQYVTQKLLPRVWGQELMLPPLVLAQIVMASRLAATGFFFRRPGKLHLYLANTMRQSHIGDASQRGHQDVFTVVVGNPPFSGISENRHGWIQALLRGRSPDEDRTVANYFQAGGEPLGERKHWLQDDYVKFMRFAHWQIEAAGAGIVALVTNHGYLDNSTFRGMREQLISTFPRITVVDLQGNKHNAIRGPTGEHDESVFEIGQGVAVSLLRRPLDRSITALIQHTDLRGPRAGKLATLQQQTASSLDLTKLRPQMPHFFLVPKSDQYLEDYERGHRLCDIMPVSSTAAVTARDGFVVAFHADELRDRLLEFRDRQIADDTIRARYFCNTRSHNYPPGDTRGWKLAEARRRLGEEPNWQRYIRSCLYRPFDQRQVFWASWMIDWPRSGVMNHLLDGDNMALVCRRQSPPSGACNFFWVTDTIAMDGLIRSDNRGSESVFPLYLSDGLPPDSTTAYELVAPGRRTRSPRRANFDADFVAYCETRLELCWALDSAASDLITFTSEDLFNYVYALFHAPIYRSRFAQWLSVDFPRVFIPIHGQLFRAMARLGAMLVDAHLLRHASPGAIRQIPDNAVKLPKGFPQYRDAAVWLDRATSLHPVAKEVWEFRVGTYQVCRKWLKDRHDRELTPDDLQHYCRILASVAETLRIMAQIDQTINAFGGWENAF